MPDSPIGVSAGLTSGSSLSPAAPTMSPRRRRTILWMSAAIPLLAAVWVSAITVRVVAPAQGSERHTDAIVSLAPYRDRLPLADHLYQSGVGDALAISWTGDHPLPPPGKEATLEQRRCTLTNDPHIHCFTPEPSTTLGEAIRVKELADQHGWNAVTVVTSRYHAFRTRLIFERCLGDDVDLEVIYAPTTLSLGGWLYHIVYENVAYLKALVETADCRRGRGG